MRALIVVSFCVLLSSCLNSNDVRMSSEHAQFVNNVGVISLLDAHANIHYAAQEPKDIIDRQAVIAGWEINRVVADHLVERMRKKGFTTRALYIDRADLNPYDNSWAKANTSSLHERLYEIGANAGVDMLVVVYRNRVNEFITKGREKVRGYGVFKTHRIEPHLYAAVYVEAIEINKRYVLGKAVGQKAQKLAGDSWQLGFKPGKEALRLPFTSMDSEAMELQELIKLASLLAAQEAGLSN
ncbi:MAG: hypothetical protein AAF387_15450 [Pseudomonadota bacterium]